MSKRYSAREVVRMALHFGIADRESFLDCLGDDGFDDGFDDICETTKAEIAAMKAMLKRRYNQKTHVDALKESPAKTVSIQDLLKRAAK